MKAYDDNLLLFFENLKRDLYVFIYCEDMSDYEFYKWEIGERIKTIAFYKKKLLEDFIQ